VILCETIEITFMVKNLLCRADTDGDQALCILPIYSVYLNCLTVLKLLLSHVCVAYCSICELFLDILKICGPLCQCNMLSLYVRQLKEVLVYCCMWMLFINMCDPDTGCATSGWSE